MPVALDSSRIGAVGEYIKENTSNGAVFSISSPIFTIYAFEELRPIVEKSGKFNFLFNEPTFVRNIVMNNKEVKEFELRMAGRERNVSEFNMEIGLKNNLDQNQIASKCYDFIKEHAEVRSVTKEGVITPNSIFVENNEKSYLITGNNISFSKDGLGYKFASTSIWSTTKKVWLNCIVVFLIQFLTTANLLWTLKKNY